MTHTGKYIAEEIIYGVKLEYPTGTCSLIDQWQFQQYSEGYAEGILGTLWLFRSLTTACCEEWIIVSESYTDVEVHWVNFHRLSTASYCLTRVQESLNIPN